MTEPPPDEGLPPRSSKRVPPGKVQHSFYVDAEDLGQARAAILNAGHLHGHRTLSSVVTELLHAWVVNQQARHNDGRPWPPDQTRRPLPRGRPPE